MRARLLQNNRSFASGGSPAGRGGGRWNRQARLRGKEEGLPTKTDTALPLAVAEYSGLQAAYDHFNAELFDNELPNVMLVETRRAHSYGHFSENRFATREGDARHHELSLNG